MSLVFGTAVLAVVGWLLYYRSTYGTFAWWQIPPRIEYCGREYDRGTTVAALPGQDTVLVQVMTVEPAGRAVYTLRSVTGTVAPVANPPCAMGLIVKQSDKYVQYGLSGGP
ncbi:hypothetical protein [Actinocrinis sp.]|uniref:hypothetical protein n=1 Tax=Actinocrinis sp. TaxID=1920516 RepID=UPI002D2D8DAD|nr:hypothetical protein [Actinocrinis sp.]HZP54127.1 hypothetical protein [Actinocrinis sp.]